MTADRHARPQGAIKVLVIPGTDPVGDWIADVVRSQPDMSLTRVARDLAEAVQALEESAPDVVMADMASGVLQRADLFSRLAAPTPGAAIIVVAMLGEVEMVRQAMLQGAQGFLLKPFSEAELLGSIRQAYELVLQRRAERAEAARLPATTQARPVAHGEVVAVFSPKGGVGCTTVAINLAVALKAATDRPTILVDADLRFGDVDAALNIASAASLENLLPQLDGIDNLLLDRSLLTHSSGIQVVIAPPHLDMADSIRPDQLKRFLVRLTELREGYVVVDAWSTLDEITLSILDVCHHLVVVTTPQVTALRDVHRFLEVMDLLGYERDKTLLVLNHCYHRSEIKLADMERALGHPIVQAIDYAPNQVTASINRGVPLVLEYRDTPTAQSILRLAQMLVDRRRVPDSQEEEAAAATQSREQAARGRGRTRKR
jgi:pilus assembly protein CpaE